MNISWAVCEIIVYSDVKQRRLNIYFLFHLQNILNRGGGWIFLKLANLGGSFIALLFAFEWFQCVTKSLQVPDNSTIF